MVKSGKYKKKVKNQKNTTVIIDSTCTVDPIVTINTKIYQEQ